MCIRFSVEGIGFDSVGSEIVRGGTCGEGGSFHDPMDEKIAIRSNVQEISGEIDGGATVDMLELPIEQGKRISDAAKRNGLVKKKFQPNRVNTDVVDHLINV